MLCNEGMHGVNANFENAILNASGDYIYLSGQNEVWLEGKVKRSMEGLCEADLVCMT